MFRSCDHTDQVKFGHGAFCYMLQGGEIYSKRYYQRASGKIIQSIDFTSCGLRETKNFYDYMLPKPVLCYKIM